jgi:aquaporin Z
MSPTIRAYFGELIGTLILVFMGTAVATLQRPELFNWGAPGLLGISFAFGGTLMVLVVAIGPVSGCHVNPAVTIAMAVAGRMPWSRVPGYIVGQLIGAVAASGALLALMQGLDNYSLAEHGLAANGNPFNLHVAALFGWELVLTSLFLLIIFAASRSEVAPGPAALAIGGFLFLAHLIGAQFGDASLNPARSFGPALWQGGEALKVLWVFTAGPLAGGLVGLLAYRLLYSEGPTSSAS